VSGCVLQHWLLVPATGAWRLHLPAVFLGSTSAPRHCATCAHMRPHARTHCPRQVQYQEWLLDQSLYGVSPAQSRRVMDALVKLVNHNWDKPKQVGSCLTMGRGACVGRAACKGSCLAAGWQSGTGQQGS
jgi:hypothetical protein